jgi:putative transcriptional regulator
MALRLEVSSLSGKFLVAMPGLQDPTFDESVIYITAHDHTGASGFIVNLPTAEGHFSDLCSKLQIPYSSRRTIPMMYGGPVERKKGTVVHSSDYKSDAGTLDIGENICATTTVDIIEELAAGRGPHRAVLFMGSCSWGPGQLEQEIMDNSWLIAERQDSLIYSDNADITWQLAMESMGVSALKLSPIYGHA